MHNTLIIGSDKEPLLHDLPPRFLFIDDGPLIDALNFPERRTVTIFDPARHSFNPLRGMDHRKARDFWNVLKAIFPEGESTLTKANAEYQILTALKEKPRKLAQLIPDTRDTQYAYQMVQKLLLSDTLSDVLTKPTNMSFKGIIIARLDRAVLGEFDCFALANLLISQFQGAVIVSDFGFYANPALKSLIRQNRLIAGISTFDEVPELKGQLPMFPKRIASRCTYDDAVVLARYDCKHLPATDGYDSFIKRCMRQQGA